MRYIPFHFAAARDSTERIIDETIKLFPNLVVGLVIFVIFLLLGGLAKRLIRRGLRSRIREGAALLLGRTGQLVMIVLGTLIGLAITAPSFKAGDIVKILGIGSVAVGFAFQNILQNFLAGVLLLLNQPFHIGDFISVTGIDGTVQDIDSRATIIKTKEGRKVVIPNATVFTNPVAVEPKAVGESGASNRNGSDASQDRSFSLREKE